MRREDGETRNYPREIWEFRGNFLSTALTSLLYSSMAQTSDREYFPESDNSGRSHEQRCFCLIVG